MAAIRDWFHRWKLNQPLSDRKLINVTMPLENKISKFEKEIASILSQLCHHIHPDIVKYVQEQNENDYEYFKELFRELIDVDSYLFCGSACIFPGVRRYVSGKGNRRKYDPAYKAIIDGNEFPRHLWCYLSNRKTYNGPNWKETGLNAFELAHVFTHKKSEIEFESRFFEKVDSGLSPYGDFTCACNVVLLSKGMVRPTDNSSVIKSVFYRRYIELYGEEPLNGRSGFKTERVPGWYTSLTWNEPYKPSDWQSKISDLMAYRKNRISKILQVA